MFSFIKNGVGLTKDLICAVEPEKILHGEKLFRSFMKYQTAWISHFYPNDKISPQGNAWHYLHKYMLPLIKQRASSYHIEGIRRLRLDAEKKPDFTEFKKLFFYESNGFQIVEVKDEIPPKQYFELISQKKFPCIERMRSLEELFCAFEPDFWHEAIGHIAPLCFPEVQEFYLEIAEYMLSAKSAQTFQEHLAVAWALMEYGFIKQNGENKMFGAALVGSHLAHMRYANGIIQVEPANRLSIIESNFSVDDGSPARNKNGTLRFFSLNNLDARYLFSADCLITCTVV